MCTAPEVIMTEAVLNVPVVAQDSGYHHTDDAEFNVVLGTSAM
jgi:hypothetical protein